jgi:hypothetical protein
MLVFLYAVYGKFYVLCIDTTFQNFSLYNFHKEVYPLKKLIFIKLDYLPAKDLVRDTVLPEANINMKLY